MIHARSDYDAIQPWPTKRPHHGVVTEEDPTSGELVRVKYLSLSDDSIEQLGDSIEPIIPDDEPVFLIRAQDVCAVPAAEAWCEAAAFFGADAGIIDTVRRHIDLVRRWQATHPTKVPDAPANALR